MDIIAKFVDFIGELYTSLNSGALFFGSVGDLVRSIVDILLVAFLISWALIFIKQSRAWQLIKGIIILYVFAFICSLCGLQMVGFLFSNFLYIFAVMVVVIFQPELRRILETVGIKSFMSIRGVVGGGNLVENKDETSVLIDEICDACKEMCKTYTGALILLERSTKLDELLIQENTTKFDSSVTSVVLQSLFYKGAPMHDGAVLIRDGKIIAARCHINAPVTLHTLNRAGTRHKAAVAASEMGDTIAIAVSEERGKSSIAVNGNLVEMKNEEELRANLRYLFGLVENRDNKKSIGNAFKNFSKKKGSKEEVKVADAILAQGNGNEADSQVPSLGKKRKKKNKVSFVERILILVVSLLISTGLWVYIQINNNPVVSRTFTVPVEFSNQSISDDYKVSYPIDTVQVEIVGRQQTISQISANNIIATLDFSVIDTQEGAVAQENYNLPVIVESRDTDFYFRVEQMIPDKVPVYIYQ